MFFLIDTPAKEGEDAEPKPTEVKTEAPEEAVDDPAKKRLQRLVTILGGELSIELHLQVKRNFR